MKWLITALLIACSFSNIAFADDTKTHAAGIDYDDQKNWQGVFGHSQSPIDIVTNTAIKAEDNEPRSIRIIRVDAPAQAIDNGHAIQVETDRAEATIRGRHFQLAQFHFHSASEHTIDGNSYPLEGHFVFKAQDGRLAVVGVMYKEGEANEAIEPVLQQLRGSKDYKEAEIDVTQLMPKDKSYYHYLGSLTTPPLTENVEWYVLKEPMTLSKAQLEELHSRHPHNNRNIQPMNGRPLIQYSAN